MADSPTVRGARRARRLLEEIKAFLSEPGDWKFSYGDLSKGSPLRAHLDETEDEDLAGITLPAIEMIFIDYRHDVIPTIVHECLHALHPLWTETGVRRAEKLVIKHLTTLDAIRLHRLFGELLYPR